MRTLVILTCLLVLSGCDQQSQQQRREAATQKAQADQEVAKRAAERAEREAEREKERQLMVTPSAIPELERRLDDWLEAKSGLLLVKDRVNATTPDRQVRGVHAVSLQTPWAVNCTRLGLGVVLGSWVEVDCSEGGGSSDLFSRRLTRAKLSESECAPLLLAVGQKMSQIMKSAP